MIYLTLEEISRIARDVLLKDGYHETVLFIEGSERSGAVRLALSDAGVERQFQLFTLGRKAGQDKPFGQLVQVFLISEAWMSIVRQGRPFTGPPSQDPDRIDVLTIYQHSVRERRRAVILFEVVQDAQGQVVAVKELQGPDVDEVQSPLLEAFLAGYVSAGQAVH